jgi:aspartate/methionine/tyrosine aminotransferase
MFSNRIQSDLSPNRLSRAVAAARAARRRFTDLTESNPTRAGFDYPDDLLAPLADPRGLIYAPHPFGLEAAREAVAADLARRGSPVSPEHVVLTASTSEAYSLLFKVLCDPGDEVVIPRPSYPLFEHLTRLDGVTPSWYDLEYRDGWAIDVASVPSALSARARAILIVSPNNPTGSLLKARELDALAEAAAGRGAALIADEVFVDYTLEGAAEPPGDVLRRDDVLAFSLGGLSKSVGLPQVKLGWIAVAGPPALREAALSRREIACDTYLSVSTPVQIAAAELFRRGAVVRAAIQQRISRNYRALAEQARRSPACRLLRAEGGWYAVVQVPSFGTEEDLVLTLFERDGILTHPGYFFDFGGGSHLIVSLLVPERSFAAATDAVFRHFDCTIGGQP